MRVVKPDNGHDVYSDRGRRGRFDKLVEEDMYRGMRNGIREGRSDLVIAESLGIAAATVRRFRHRTYGRPAEVKS